MSVDMVALDEVAKFIRGITFKPTDKMEPFSEGSIVCFRTSNVQDDLDQSDLIAVPKSMMKRKEQRVIEGDILVSTANSWNLVGKCSWIPKLRYEATIGGFISILRAKPQSVDARYLYHWFNSPETQLYARNCGRQTTNISNMDINRALKLQIPLPPLAEQQRIAAILDKADALRAKRRTAVARLDALLQSTFLHLFGDPVTNPMGWELKSIKDMCDLVRGSSPRPKDDSRYYGGAIPRLMVADLTRDGFFVTPQIDSLTEEGAKKSRYTRKGTVVMAVSGNVGLTAILNIDACIHDGFVAFNDLDERIIKPRFFMYSMHLLKQTHESRKDGAIFQNTTTTAIKAMQIPTPSLELQNKWEMFFDNFLVLQQSYRKSTFEADNLFHALQQRAFKGEL